MSCFCNTPIFQILCSFPSRTTYNPPFQNGMGEKTVKQPKKIFQNNINNNHKACTKTVTPRNSYKKSLKKKQKAFSLDQSTKKPQIQSMQHKILQQKFNPIHQPTRIIQTPKQNILFNTPNAFQYHPSKMHFIQRDNNTYPKNQKKILQPFLGYQISFNNNHQHNSHFSLKRQPFDKISMNQSSIPISQQNFYQKKLRTQPSQKLENQPARQINYQKKIQYNCPKLSNTSHGKNTKQSQNSFTVNNLSKEDQSLSRKIIFTNQKTNRKILQNAAVRRTQSILDHQIQTEYSEVILCTEFKLFDQKDKQNCSNSKTFKQIEKLNKSNNQIQIRTNKQTHINQ